MKFVVTGATGFIGRSLCEALLNRGDELLILTRSSKPKVPLPESKIRTVTWNPEVPASVVREIDGCGAVINLAGESIIKGRWTKKKKQKMLESRIHATQIIANSIKQAERKPKVLINASAVGYYGPHENESLTEEERSGSDFLAEICRAWEAHAIRVEDYNVRVVRLRIGIVLGKAGGALKMMIPPFRMGLGGWLGSGNQWMSWIHLDDLVRLIIFCLENVAAKGPVNAASPQPVTNKVFSMVLAQVLKRPCLFPIPAIALKILLGQVSEVLLTGQRALPNRAEALGFSFRYADIRNALEAVLR